MKPENYANLKTASSRIEGNSVSHEQPRDFINDNSSKFGLIKRQTMVLLLFILLVFNGAKSYSQMTTIPAGSFIVDMGIVPQTVNNALKPYGMVYHLITQHAIPVLWVIDPNKVKDGPDFIYNNYAFKGGPFIVEAQYRNATTNAEIAYWQSLGVVGITTTSPVQVNVFKTLIVSAAPHWTLDKQNGAIALDFFNNAGIPSTAYGGATSSTWKNPADLDCCDNIFVMPHADPLWSTHGHLLDWNHDCKGSIWLGCHAGSALMDMFNPANPSQQTNFLVDKTETASTSGPKYYSPYYENALVLWSHHTVGSIPYTYNNGGDPIMQFMGTIDLATQNGSEQIYIPAAGGWSSWTVVGGFDPDNTQRYMLSDEYKYRAAVIAYGRGFGNNDNGMVMLEASHDIAKSTGPANIAAQRAFFNFSFVAARVSDPDPGFDVQLGSISSSDTVPVSFTLTGPRDISEFNIAWSSSCGGTFLPANTQSTSYVAPAVASPTNCIITITLTEKSSCARVYKNSTTVLVACGLQVTSTVNPACYGLTNGYINMSITGGVAPFLWSWTKSGGGSGSGTGTSITGLAPGTYTVTITSDNGNGCAKTFSVNVYENPQLTASASAVNSSCYGGSSGSVNLTVSGGSPAYTYLWNGGATTQNRSGLVELNPTFVG